MAKGEVHFAAQALSGQSEMLLGRVEAVNVEPRFPKSFQKIAGPAADLKDTAPPARPAGDELFHQSTLSAKGEIARFACGPGFKFKEIFVVVGAAVHN